MIIEGRPVLEIMPNFANAPRLTARRASMLADLSPAKRIEGYNGIEAIHMLSHEYVLGSKADIESFSEFFDEMSGKWDDFWVPSWRGELNPLEDLSIGETALNITPVDYNATYLTSSETTRLGHYIWIVGLDGTWHVSKVLSCADGSPEVLTLETAPSSDFLLGNYLVGFLYHVRFVNDSLSLEFNGPNCASTALSFIESLKTAGSADA